VVAGVEVTTFNHRLVLITSKSIVALPTENTIAFALLRYNAPVGALGTVHVLKLNGKPFGAAPATVRRQALCLAFIKNHWVF